MSFIITYLYKHPHDNNISHNFQIQFSNAIWMGFDALIINGPIAFSLSIIRNLSAHFVLHMKNNGMFKYFLKDFEGLGKIHVTMTFRKMSQLILKKT